MDDSVSGGIILGETTAGAVTLKTEGGNISLGDNSVLDGTTVSAESADLNKTVYSNDGGSWNTVASTESWAPSKAASRWVKILPSREIPP